MPSGGHRPGAGRKLKSETFARPIARAEKRIADKLPWLIDKQFELAAGVTIQQETDDGPILYQRPPDRQAVEYLLNRIMGKPTERQELSGSDGGPIEVEVALSDEARAERVTRILDGIRTRAAGPAATAESDLGTATGPAD